MTGNEVVRIQSKEIEPSRGSQQTIIQVDDLNNSKMPLAITTGAVSWGAVGALASLIFVPDQFDAIVIMVSTLSGASMSTWMNAFSKAETAKEQMVQMGILPPDRKLYGMWKTFLPFGRKLFPYVYRVNRSKPKPKGLQDIRYSAQDKANISSVNYTVKRVKGGVQVYPELPPDPMESWDKLYFDETGENINKSRPASEKFYNILENPNRGQVLSAKISRNLNNIQNKENPLWLEEMANAKWK